MLGGGRHPLRFARGDGVPHPRSAPTTRRRGLLLSRTIRGRIFQKALSTTNRPINPCLVRRESSPDERTPAHRGCASRSNAETLNKTKSPNNKKNTERRKRRELSSSATKSLTKHSVNITLDFD